MEKPILKNRAFIFLFLASFLAIIGFSMFFMTTTWFVISELGSASLLGIILIAVSVPRVLMMAFGGVIADKYKKTTIMFSTSFIQGILLVAIFFSKSIEPADLWLPAHSRLYFWNIGRLFWACWNVINSKACSENSNQTGECDDSRIRTARLYCRSNHRR